MHAQFNSVIHKSLSPHNNTSSSTSHTVHHTLIYYLNFQWEYTTRAKSNTLDLPTPQLGATTLGLRIEPKNINSHVLELRI
jgi:hypothetical protein